MGIHKLEATQSLPIDIQAAWEFFSNPANLNAITPPRLGFQMTSKAPTQMYPGLFLTYRVRPLFNVPLDWVTEITQVEAPLRFIDEQRSGPYRIWHHEHHFREVPGGVEMRDVVYYSIGFGPIGDLIARTVVRKRVHEIFRYRKRVLEQRFGVYPRRPEARGSERTHDGSAA